MNINKEAIEKEPWLQSFTENVNIDRELTEDEETEVNQIRENLNSKSIRCKVIKKTEIWNVGDEVGIREKDFKDYRKVLTIIGDK